MLSLQILYIYNAGICIQIDFYTQISAICMHIDIYTAVWYLVHLFRDPHSIWDLICAAQTFYGGTPSLKTATIYLLNIHMIMYHIHWMPTSASFCKGVELSCKKLQDRNKCSYCASLPNLNFWHLPLHKCFTSQCIFFWQLRNAYTWLWQASGGIWCYRNEH